MRTFLPEQTRISQVHLRTANLHGAQQFYTDVLGLKVRHGPGARAVFSTTEERPGLLVLTEDLNAPSRPALSTGLYHFAIRYPRRQDLARAYRRLLESGYPVAGASDHGVSEAIYLSDPDGNGVELYTDRPRVQWRWREGQVGMATGALDLGGLLALAAGGSSTSDPPAQTDVGHVHIHVADLAMAERFYSEFLGLTVTQRSYPGALFFAAGGYHHHVGVNIWAGQAAPPPDGVGLISYRFEVPITEILYCLDHRAPLQGYETRPGPREEGGMILQIRDPNGNWLEVQASPTATEAWPGMPCPESSAVASNLPG